MAVLGNAQLEQAPDRRCQPGRRHLRSRGRSVRRARVRWRLGRGAVRERGGLRSVRGLGPQGLTRPLPGWSLSSRGLADATTGRAPFRRPRRAPRPPGRDRRPRPPAAGACRVEDAHPLDGGVQAAVDLQRVPVARGGRLLDRGQLGRRLLVRHHHGLGKRPRPLVEDPAGWPQTHRVAAHDDHLDGTAGRGQRRPQAACCRPTCGPRSPSRPRRSARTGTSPAVRRALAAAWGGSSGGVFVASAMACSRASPCLIRLTVPARVGSSPTW